MMSQLARRKSTSELNPLDAIAVSALVKDLVLFGQNDLSGVLEAHGIDQDALLDLSDTPVFKSELAALKKQLADDPHATLRMVAKQGLEMQVPNVTAIADDVRNAVTDRLKAVELLARLADALPKTTKAEAPALPVLQINFGGFPPVNPRIINQP